MAAAVERSERQKAQQPTAKKLAVCTFGGGGGGGSLWALSRLLSTLVFCGGGGHPSAHIQTVSHSVIQSFSLSIVFAGSGGGGVLKLVESSRARLLLLQLPPSMTQKVRD